MDDSNILRDPLTGVYSLAYLHERLREEADRARRHAEAFSLLMVDLDYFKSDNDAFGHARGDQVLQAFVARVQGLIRSSDVLFRYGGDEFVVLLPNTPLAQAEILSKRILDNVSALPFPGEPALALSLSGGLAGFPAEAVTPEALFEIADQRHYEAKRTGRGRIVADGPAAALFLPFDELSRIVGRDQELRDVNAFVRGLAARGGVRCCCCADRTVWAARGCLWRPRRWRSCWAAKYCACGATRRSGRGRLRPWRRRGGTGGARRGSRFLPRPGWATRCKNK